MGCGNRCAEPVILTGSPIQHTRPSRFSGRAFFLCWDLWPAVPARPEPWRPCPVGQSNRLLFHCPLFPHAPRTSWLPTSIRKSDT